MTLYKTLVVALTLAALGCSTDREYECDCEIWAYDSYYGIDVDESFVDSFCGTVEDAAFVEDETLAYCEDEFLYYVSGLEAYECGCTCTEVGRC